VPALAFGADPPAVAPGKDSPERIAAKIAAHETIQRCRQDALDVLKPKPKDLEHGTALHSQSVVFDGYAFAPQAAVDAPSRIVF